MVNSLRSNRVYNDYLPKIILSLSLMYIISYLTLYVLYQYRRFQERKKQQEKKRLKRRWQHSMQRWKSPSVTYPSPCHTLTSSSSTLETFTPPLSSTIFQGGGCKVVHNMPKLYGNVDNNGLMPVMRVEPRYKNRWISRPKKLALLWHWSVSMGYVEYDHAKNIDALIKQLSSAEIPLLTEKPSSSTEKSPSAVRPSIANKKFVAG